MLLLAFVVPISAVTARRLHDTNRSAWWMLVYYIPYIAEAWMSIQMLFESHPDVNNNRPWYLLWSLLSAIGGIWLFVLTLLDSYPETNEWGPNPKANEEES